ncbi:MAG: hypothetical protein U0324_30050 [Polyangiales bacterium]
MTTLRTLLTELPPAWLAPAVVVCALVGALVARVAVGALWHLVMRLRAPRDAPPGPADALTDGAAVTRHGALSVDADGAVTLRTGDASFALEGPVDEGRRALAAKRARAIVRGTYHRRAEASGGEAYRDATRRHAITGAEVAPLHPPAPARLAYGVALAGALLGGVAGVGVPSRVVPRTLAAAPRRPHLRVRSIEPFRVVLERVPEEMDPTCPRRLRAPARWGVAREECEPTVTLVSPAPELRAYVPGRLAGASPRATGRSIALALGWPALAAELAVVPGDAAAYRTAIRESFAAGDYDSVWRDAREAPAEAHPGVAAEVLTTYLFTRHNEPGAAAFAQRVAAAAPAGTAESLACIETFWAWPAGRSAAEALAYATRPGAPPACVILGATTARRGLDSLRPLEALRRDDPVWRPVIDAAKNFALLEAIASGSIRAPAPSRFEAYGDPAELRASMNAGVAHLIDSTAGILETRGYFRLAWQTRFPAREAIVRGLIFDPPAGASPDVRRRQIEQWVESMAADYRRADERAPSARARDRRLDDAAMRRLGDDAVRSARELAWQLAYAEALFGEVWPGAERAALRELSAGAAFGAARVAPSIVAAGAAALTPCAGDRCAPCSIDRAACAWAFDALRDPAAAAQPWRDRRVVRDFGHAQADFERRAQYVEETRRRQARSPVYGAGHGPPWGGYGALAHPWVDPLPPAGAFVLAVTEALQRSLAAAR